MRHEDTLACVQRDADARARAAAVARKAELARRAALLEKEAAERAELEAKRARDLQEELQRIERIRLQTPRAPPKFSKRHP